MSRRGTYSFISKCAYLTFVIVAIVAAQEKCDKTKCAGPLKYYESLGCKPVYENEGDCCAIKYDCDHLKERSKENCYVNGNKYEIGEPLRDEDANRCDSCSCNDTYGGASFLCSYPVNCFNGDIEFTVNDENKYCYVQYSPIQCCPGPLVCAKKEEDIPTCVVDDKIYKAGDHFEVESDPELNCVCGPNYKGENVSPFCSKQNRSHCDPFFYDANKVHDQCAPIYSGAQPVQTSCYMSFKCHDDDDYVIHNHESHEEVDEVNVCIVGNLTMHLGDELNETSQHYPVHTKCVCEIPPVPTCIYFLPDVPSPIHYRYL